MDKRFRKGRQHRAGNPRWLSKTARQPPDGGLGCCAAGEVRNNPDPARAPGNGSLNPPVILMNGWQFNCTDQNSTVADSVGTFGAMASALSPSVLFFNNCAYGDIPIEQLAGQLAPYIAGLTYPDGTPVAQVDLVTHSMGGLIVPFTVGYC
jgi:hypothetical protein